MRRQPASVYHITSTNNLSCLGEGLRPDPSRGEERWRELERGIDAECPDYLRSQGVTRANSVFAYPNIEVPHDIYRTRTSKVAQTGLKLAVIELKVDPTTAYVLDAVHIDMGSMDEDDPWYYWSSAITLEQFFAEFSVGTEWAHRTSTRIVHSGLRGPEQYRLPEILIPHGVKPEDMTLESISEYDVSTGKW